MVELASYAKYASRKKARSAQHQPIAVEENSVNGFLANADAILQTAENGLRSGHTPTDFVILLGCGAGIRMVADSDWSLEALQVEHGAHTAYRVGMRGDKILVEGKESGRYCRLETETPTRTAQMVLGSRIPSFSSGDLMAHAPSDGHYRRLSAPIQQA